MSESRDRVVGAASRNGGTVTMRREGPVAILTINRPEVRNAIDHPTAAALDAFMEDIEGDDSIDAAVLSASGDRAFCAGSDLKAKARNERRPITERGGFAGFVAWPRLKPVVAAVEGPALGGGFELVLACDLVVASEHASFGLPEVRHGIVAGGGGLFRLPRRLPFPLAAEVILLGSSLDAEQGHQRGLVNRVVPPGQAEAVAIQLASRLCGPPALAIRESLRVMRAATAAGEDKLWELTEAASLLTQASDQGRAGVQAFARTATRPPS